MNAKVMSIRCCFVLLLLLMASTASSDEHRYDLSVEKARAPLALIGSSVRDWVLFFEEGYTHSVRPTRNIHTGEPVVLVTLSKGETEAQFFVDLATGKQFLLSVESTSDDFLNRMYLQLDDLESGKRHFCDEDGYDCVELKANGLYGRRGLWTFYVD